jgi:phosphoserine phosphatase
MFLQTTIALIWDFDTTLIPGYMQGPLFRHYGVDETAFWAEVNGLPQFYQRAGATRVCADTAYLNHILAYTRAGKFKGLNNAKLQELGGEIEFYAGLPDFFKKVRDSVAADTIFAQHEIHVEHHIVSTGLAPMIRGSKIAPFADGVWACEFAEVTAPPGYLEQAQPKLFEGRSEISQVAYALDNTSKTRAIFEINKGTNKHPLIDVNASIPPEKRRIPFENMIYIGDGPSDIPSFSLVGHFGGRTFAVYKPKSEPEFAKAFELQKQHRVQAFGEADYTDGSQTSMWIMRTVGEIARTIVRDRSRSLKDGLGQPPEHVLDEVAAARDVAVESALLVPKKTPVSASSEVNVVERMT